MREFGLLFVFLISLQVEAREAKATPFQQNIKQCLPDLDQSKMQNLNDLYRLIDEKYPLRTSETLYREVLYKEKSQLKKLKLEKGMISTYYVMDDDTLKLVNNDARQKGLTDESAVNQLLLRADIREDWLKVKEVRSGQTLLQLGKDGSAIKSLTIQKVGAPWKLECQNKESSDICLCHK